MPRTHESPACGPADVMFVFSANHSVDRQEFEDKLRVVEEFVERLGVGAGAGGVRVCVEREMRKTYIYIYTYKT